MWLCVPGHPGVFVHMYLYMLACVHVQVSEYMCRHVIMSMYMNVGVKGHTSYCGISLYGKTGVVKKAPELSDSLRPTKMYSSPCGPLPPPGS